MAWRVTSRNMLPTKENNVPMVATLQEILLAPDTKPRVTADCMTLIQQEVSAKSGVSGTAVKLAYKTVNAVASGYVQSMVETMLPDMIDRLEPYWADFSTSGAGDFGDYLVKRAEEVSEALLSVTDERAAAAERPMVIKAYRSVRGSAAKHVTAALPAVGALVQTYAPWPVPGPARRAAFLPAPAPPPRPPGRAPGRAATAAERPASTPR